MPFFECFLPKIQGEIFLPFEKYNKTKSIGVSEANYSCIWWHNQQLSVVLTSRL